MTILETNRETVLIFCEHISSRNFSAMPELLTSDATWWVIGRKDYASYGGLNKASDVLTILDSFLGALDEFSFSVDGSIAEGDRVVVEATSAGSKGAARYKNSYLMRYQLRDGKIASLREFMDGYEIADFIKQLGPDGTSVF